MKIQANIALHATATTASDPAAEPGSSEVGTQDESESGAARVK